MSLDALFISFAFSLRLLADTILDPSMLFIVLPDEIFTLEPLMILALSLLDIELLEIKFISLSAFIMPLFNISPFAFILILLAFMIPALLTPTPSLVAMMLILLAYMPPRFVLSIDITLVDDVAELILADKGTLNFPEPLVSTLPLADIRFNSPEWIFEATLIVFAMIFV